MNPEQSLSVPRELKPFKQLPYNFTSAKLGAIADAHHIVAITLGEANLSDRMYEISIGSPISNQDRANYCAEFLKMPSYSDYLISKLFLDKSTRPDPAKTLEDLFPGRDPVALMKLVYENLCQNPEIITTEMAEAAVAVRKEVDELVAKTRENARRAQLAFHESEAPNQKQFESFARLESSLREIYLALGLQKNADGVKDSLKTIRPPVVQ